MSEELEVSQEQRSEMGKDNLPVKKGKRKSSISKKSGSHSDDEEHVPQKVPKLRVFEQAHYDRVGIPESTKGRIRQHLGQKEQMQSAGNYCRENTNAKKIEPDLPPASLHEDGPDEQNNNLDKDSQGFGNTSTCMEAEVDHFGDTKMVPKAVKGHKPSGSAECFSPPKKGCFAEIKEKSLAELKSPEKNGIPTRLNAPTSSYVAMALPGADDVPPPVDPSEICSRQAESEDYMSS